MEMTSGKRFTYPMNASKSRWHSRFWIQESFLLPKSGVIIYSPQEISDE